MNFKKAMDNVADGKTVKVTPNCSGEYPYLVKIGVYKEVGDLILQCRSLTMDGTHLDPGLDWEPVCYLLCFDDYLDGEWEVVDAKDYRFEGDDE